MNSTAVISHTSTPVSIPARQNRNILRQRSFSSARDALQLPTVDRTKKRIKMVERRAVMVCGATDNTSRGFKPAACLGTPRYHHTKATSARAAADRQHRHHLLLVARRRHRRRRSPSSHATLIKDKRRSRRLKHFFASAVPIEAPVCPSGKNQISPELFTKFPTLQKTFIRI